MRSKLFFASLPFSVMALVWACSGDNSSTPPGGDAAAETGDDADTGTGVETSPPPDTAPNVHCQLGDKSDPVALCTEKTVLKAVVDYKIYAKGQGMPATWDSMTFAPGNDHSWQSDLGLAGSIANYDCNAVVYGDNEINAELNALLPDVAGLLVKELAPLPADYDGETYFRLRNAAQGLYFIVDLGHAMQIASIADAYGAAIQSAYAHAVPAMSDGGDGGAPGVVLGTPMNGAIAYQPAKVVMGAAALLDMALVHAGDADAGALSAQWQATAAAALDYVSQRGRDPMTGLYFDSLVTSGDPGHDALPTGDPGILHADTQAAIALGLARAQDLTVELAVIALQDAGLEGGNGGDAGPPPPYAQRAADLVAAVNAAGLWDGSTDPMATTPGAFMEAVLPGGIIDTNKTTYGNAFLLGGYHRVAFALGSAFSYELKQVRAALIQDKPANSSLFTVVGALTQSGYLRASSRDWQAAVDFSADGGMGGPEQGATLYRTEAMTAMVEGFTQLWHGDMHSAKCGN